MTAQFGLRSINMRSRVWETSQLNISLVRCFWAWRKTKILGVDRKIFVFRYASLCLCCGAIASIRLFQELYAIARQQHRLGREATISLGFWALDRNFIQCDRLMVLVEID